MSTPLLAIGPAPLALEPLIAAVSAACRTDRGVDGAVATFLGLVRNHNVGRRVLYLEYEAYEPLALKAFERIAAEIGGQLAGRAPGAASPDRPARDRRGQRRDRAASAHRADAFAACRYAIERVKQIAPIWKHEFFEGGDVWIEGATADPDDRAARAAAERAACA